MAKPKGAGPRITLAIGGVLLLAAGCGNAETARAANEEPAESEGDPGAGADPQANAGEARAFLESIYAVYETSGAGHDFARPETLFEPELAAAIAADFARAEREDSMPLIAADPFCACQDWEPFTAEIGEPEMDGDRATAEVRFTNFGQPMSRTVELVRTPSGWRVADIDPEGYSFRAEVLQAQ